MATFLGALRLALSAISRNTTRAALTVLGILIGITAVVVVTALAESTSAAVVGRIDSMATNMISVWPQNVQASGARARTAGRLTENDGHAVLQEAGSISDVTPFESTNGQIVYGDKNTETFIVGTTLPYYKILAASRSPRARTGPRATSS